MAAGDNPGTDKIVGRVGVRVLPDTSQFTERLRAQLAAVEDKLKVEIPTSLDTSGVLKDVATLNRRLKAASGQVEIGVRADTARAAESVEALKRKVEATTAKIDVRVDGTFARTLQAQITKALRDVEPHIPITAEGEQFRLDVAAKVREVERIVKVGVPLDVEKAADWRAKVIADVAEIEALAQRFHPTVEIEAHVDRSALDRAQQAVTGLLNDLRGVAAVRLGALSPILDQIVLVSSRAIAYTTLLGPPILLAAAGALALAPALATSLPVLGAIGAAVGVVALGFDALFGAKVRGQPRSGGVFDPLRQQIIGLKTDIGQLLAAGLEPLVTRLQTATFPAFTNGLRQVAGAVNVALRGFLDFASTARAAAGTRAVFAGIAGALRDVGLVAGPLSSALLTLTVAALPGFRLLNDYLLTLALRFSNFITRANASGQLSRVITKATEDLIAFVGALGRITGRVFDVLQALEPSARIVFSALGSGLETALTAISNAIANFRLGDTIFAPLLTGLATFIGVVRGVPFEIVRALAPLLQSQEFATFVAGLGNVVLQLSILFAELAKAVTVVVGGLIQLVGIPVVGALGSLLQSLADLLAALNLNQTAVAAFAALFVSRFIPAMIVGARGGIAILRLALQPLAASLSGVAVAAGRVATALVTVFVSSIVNVVASIGGFKGALLSTSTQIGVLRGAALTARGALAGLAASLLSLTAVATAGLAVALIGLTGGLSAWAEAQQKARDEVDKLTDSVDVFSGGGTDVAIAKLRGIARQSVETGKSVSTMAAGFELFKKGITFGNADTPIADAAARGVAAVEAAGKLERAQANRLQNILEISKTVGASAEQIKALAAAGKVDLSKPFQDSESARAQVISQLDLIRAKTGLTVDQLVAAAGPSTQAWEQFAKAITDAQAAVRKSFTAQTDIISVFRPDSANKAVEKSAAATAKAQQHLDDVVARIDAKASARRKITVTDLNSLTNAQKAVGQAQNKAAAANGLAAAAQLGPTYQRLVKQTTDFNTNITKALKAGLDPRTVARLLEAGPAQAAPFLQAIVSDHTGLLVKISNEAEATLRDLNVRILEQTRLVTLAVQDGTDRKLSLLPKASQIAAEKAVEGAKATVESIAKALKIPAAEVQSIAEQFGITLVNAVQGAVDIRPITLNAKIGTVTAKQAQLEKQAARGFRTGGLVAGPGSWTSDSIPAWLSNFEFVQPAAVVAHYGVDVMEALRSQAIPRAALQALARGESAGLVSKLAAMAPPPAPAAHRALSAPVMNMATLGDTRPANGGPLTLVLVDHEGALMGTLRAEVARSQRQTHQARRLAQLGSGRLNG